MIPVENGQELLPMSNEARGHAIKRRRMALGIKSYDEFAKATGVSRGAITRAETGDPAATEATYLRLETWLDRFEHKTSSDAVEAAEAAAASGQVEEHTVEYRLSGDFGVDLLVKGPVSNIAEMEASIGRLLDRMRSKPET
jgi:transcriptional regulator with XRE-family HTH domain